jgi:hypothetical protein
MSKKALHQMSNGSIQHPERLLRQDETVSPMSELAEQALFANSESKVGSDDKIDAMMNPRNAEKGNKARETQHSLTK